MEILWGVCVPEFDGFIKPSWIWWWDPEVLGWIACFELLCGLTDGFW